MSSSASNRVGHGRFLAALATLLFVVSTVSSQKRPQQEELFSFGEDQPANTRIGSSTVYEALMKSEKLRSQFASADQRSLRFDVLKNEPIGRYFRIDSVTSALYLTEQMDRDDLCRAYQQCCNDEKNCVMSLIVSVALANNQERELMSLRIELQDKDDNAPIFPRESYTVEIREDAAINTKFSLLAARDRDTTANGIARYSLRNASDAFGLFVPNVNNVFLNLLRPLDREVQERYSFVLVAEGRNSQKTGEMRIEVTVRDANDHHPVFLNRSYAITIPEDFPLHTEVLRVEAIDRDDGENGRVIYDLDLTNDHQQTLFEIDPDTGAIYLKAPLDYEKDDVHVLRVQAKDGGNHPTFAEATVTIRVTDVNDCAPEIQLEAYDNAVEVFEGRERPLPVGVSFAIVRDLDRTNATNGNFSCSLNDTRFRLFNYAETKTLFKINLTVPLDRERRAIEYVAITCIDRGSPALTSEKVLTIIVKDVNDHEPKFTETSYDIYVLEHSRETEPIFTLNATDEDDSSELHYSLDAEGSRYLSIEENTGRLFLRRQIDFDREMAQRYTFTARVVDATSASSTSGRRFTATATINLHIRDANDNSPRFSQNEYTFRKMENEEGFVGTVRATDLDSFTDQLGQKVEYRIVENDVEPLLGVAARQFEVRPSGEVHVRSKLDREEAAVYNLTVLATDFSGPAESRRTATARLVILVSDANDNAPRINWPSLQNNTLRVSFRTPRGSAIARVMATDADDGANARLAYAVVQTALKRDEFSTYADTQLENTLLTIDDRGTLRIGRELSALDAGQYVLTLKVTDGAAAGAAQSTSTKLYLTIDDSAAQQYNAEVIVDETQGVDGWTGWEDSDRRSDVQRVTRQPGGSDQALLHLIITLLLAAVFLVLVIVIVVVIIRRVKAERKAATRGARRKTRKDRAADAETAEYAEFENSVDKFLAKLLCVTSARNEASTRCRSSEKDARVENGEDEDNDDDLEQENEHDRLDDSPRSEDRTYATLDSTAISAPMNKLTAAPASACRSLQRVAKHDRQAVHVYDECANNAYLDYTLGTCHQRASNMLPQLAYCGSQAMCFPYPQCYSTYMPNSTQKSLQHQQNVQFVRPDSELAATFKGGKEPVYVHKPLALRAKSAADGQNSSCYDEPECTEENNNQNTGSRSRHELSKYSGQRNRRESVDGTDREIEQVLASASTSRTQTVVSCSPHRNTASAASLHAQTQTQMQMQLAAVVKGSYV